MHCQTHTIPKGAVKIEEDFCPTEKELGKALTYMRSKNITPNFGDLVEFKEYSGYRNDGIMIFDGEKIIDLDSEIDDYGALPQNFRVLTKNADGTRFPLFYWHDYFRNYSNDAGDADDADDAGDDDSWRGIDHNVIVWFDHRPYLDEIVENITYDKKLYKSTSKKDKYAIYTHFTNDDGTRIYIVLIYQEVLYPMTLNSWEKFKLGYKVSSIMGSSSSRKVTYVHDTLPEYVEKYNTKDFVGLYDDSTYKLEPTIINDLKQRMVKLLSTNKLIPFNCADPNEFYSSIPTDKILYIDLDRQVN